jgi:hypothetical protein
MLYYNPLLKPSLEAKSLHLLIFAFDLKENCEKIRTENDTLMNLPLTVNFYVSYKKMNT